MEAKKTMKKKVVYTFFLLIGIANLIVWGLVLINKLNPKKKGTHQTPYISIDLDRVKMPPFKIGGGSEGEGLSADDLNAALNILVFFSFDDCASCLFEAEFWSLAAKMYPDEIKIVGIVNEKNDEFISAFIDEYDISFPIIVDEGDQLKNKILSLRSISKSGIITPFKIFVSNQHIFHVEGPKKIMAEQEQFPERVLQFLIKLREQRKSPGI
ncbi:MAG: redoxin domain-containing protein [Candidatus Aminicenantes bacterium]|nr:MAG: redoxin domain-containing protein [Candidatus Aminicenantes bacterium]